MPVDRLGQLIADLNRTVFTSCVDRKKGSNWIRAKYRLVHKMLFGDCEPGPCLCYGRIPMTCVHGRMPTTCVHGRIPTTCVHGRMLTTCVHGRMLTTCVHGRVPTTCVHGHMLTTRVHGAYIPE